MINPIQAGYLLWVSLIFSLILIGYYYQQYLRNKSRKAKLKDILYKRNILKILRNQANYYLKPYNIPILVLINKYAEDYNAYARPLHYRTADDIICPLKQNSIKSLIVLNTGVFKKASIKALQAIVGHELGHLVHMHQSNKIIQSKPSNCPITALAQNLLPYINPPKYIKHYNIHRHIEEIIADTLSLRLGASLEGWREVLTTLPQYDDQEEYPATTYRLKLLEDLYNDQNSRS